MTTLIPSVLITLMYFLAGVSKIFNFSSVVNGFADLTKLPLTLAQLAIVLVIILEIVAPVIIVSASFKKDENSRKWAKWAAWSLAGFTVLATLLYHFPPTGAQYYPFISNVTAVGALLLISSAL
jgi:uncharacterized membrane protein YphA (DoxX/SURF4 family)